MIQMFIAPEKEAAFNINIEDNSKWANTDFKTLEAAEKTYPNKLFRQTPISSRQDPQSRKAVPQYPDLSNQLDKNAEMANQQPPIKVKDAIHTTLDERGKRYGVFLGHATITQGLKNVMLATRNWEKLSADKKEALDMIAHKIGRILNGDPEYKDSWQDLAGYPTLVADTLKD